VKHFPTHSDLYPYCWRIEVIGAEGEPTKKGPDQARPVLTMPTKGWTALTQWIKSVGGHGMLPVGGQKAAR